MDRSKRSLCPNLDSIALRADSVGGIKTYRNTKGTTYDNHPVLEALEFACNPKHLCLTFNLPHPQSEARRRIRIAGPMPGRGGPPGIIPGGAVRIMRGGIGSVNEERLPNFRSRINCLVRGWTRLSSLCCHEVDNEDLPNLTGVKHSYSFASSFRPKETFEIPPRPDPPPGLSPVEQRRSPWQVRCNSAFSQSVPKSSESIAQESITTSRPDGKHIRQESGGTRCILDVLWGFRCGGGRE